MAVDVTKDQANAISRLQNISAVILDAVAQAKLLRQESVDKGYGTGGAQVLTDAIVQGNGFPQLTAQNIFDAFTAIADIDTQLAATSRTDYIRLEKLRP